MASKTQPKNGNGRSQKKSRDECEGRKETGMSNFPTMPFLPATGAEKEGTRKGNLWQRRAREGHHCIQIHWDDLNKKGYKTLPGRTSHGKNAYN